MKSNSLKIFGVNAAGIKSKLKSFDEILTRLNPQVWMLQETKLKPDEKISCEASKAFQIYYLNRQNLQGGGLALGVVKELESTLIREGNDETEAISVNIVMGEATVRTILAYGPQENALKEKKDKFWEFIEEEVNQAELEGHGVLLQMDGNLHAGPELVKNDPNIQNKNGKLFSEFLNRNPSLIVVNALSLCEGIITRKRELQSRTEEAVLDFFVINDKMLPFLKKMLIDEDREYCLSNFAQLKKNKRVIETDHNGLIMEFDLKVCQRKPEREEMFNLRNKTCQEAFKEMTENNKKLLECFTNDSTLEFQSKKWNKLFNSILFKCFRKIRIVKKKKERGKTENLLKERLKLKNSMKSSQIDEEMKVKIEERIMQIENEIGNKIAEEHLKDIVETVKKLGGEDDSLNGSGRQKMWSLLKKKYPKSVPVVPVAKKDRSGNLITNHMGLKHLYLQTYIHRLRNRPIKTEFHEIKKLKTELFDLRLKLSQGRKTEPWNMKQLEKALKSLKKDKARDPNGLVNEIFKEGVAGTDLKLSLLQLFNKIKADNYIPDFIRKADVTTIYKGKGEKCDLSNDRGIFIVTIFRSILMKLIYLDKYDEIDSSMSDSQVGARKGKNIRNHIWIVNGIICDVLSSKKKTPVDIQIFDYKQCFDSLWLEECLNDMYTGGLQDDKLALLYNINTHVNVAVKTPVGKTKTGSINNAIIQGDVFGPILCSKQVDNFGKECLDERKYTYTYKGEVEIPPLGMVDDLLCISECGFKTTMMNSYMKFQTNSKKLQFGVEKCKKIHVGKYCDEFKCQSLSVDRWKEVEVKDTEKGITNLEDICVGEEVIEEKEEEKYLGDIISKDGRNLKNIKSRISKGKGIVTKIMSILESIPFGKYYFEVAIILRNCLLSSSMLCNSEAWYNVTKSEMNLLETVDVMLLRKILKAPKSTPTEMLYLELGCLPYRDLIRKRRMSFLYYILHENTQSMVYRFFETQLKNRKSRDWASTVLKDIEELNLNVTLADIQAMNKTSFKSMLKRSVNHKALKDLENRKLKHSKVNHIKHTSLKMQKYLLPNELKIRNEESQLIFKLRCRVTETKINLKGMFDSFECDLCGKDDESQEHILKCIELVSMNKEIDVIPNYEKLFDGKPHEQLDVAKVFKLNMVNREKIIKNRKEK